MSTRNKRQWENRLTVWNEVRSTYITEHNWYNWWAFVILNHVKQWKHIKQLFSYFSTNITSNCSCKLIIYAGLNQNQSLLHNNTFHFSLQKLTRVHKEGELECSSIFLNMIHWNEIHLEGWGSSDDLRPLRQTQIIIRSLIPKVRSFPATPALEI